MEELSVRAAKAMQQDMRTLMVYKDVGSPEACTPLQQAFTGCRAAAVCACSNGGAGVGVCGLLSR